MAGREGISRKSRAAASILAALLGLVAADDIYLRKYGRAFLRVFLAVLAAVLWLGWWLMSRESLSAVLSGGVPKSTSQVITFLRVCAIALSMVVYALQMVSLGLTVAGKARDGEGCRVLSWAGDETGEA